MFVLKKLFSLKCFVIFLFIIFIIGCTAPVTGGGDDKGDPKNTNPTGDVTAPVWITGYPAVDNISTTEFSVNVSINEAGTVYGIIVEDGADEPTVSQVKAQDDYGTVPIIKDSTNSVDPDIEITIAFTELLSDTDYDVYLVAEDSSGNIMSSVSKLDIKTLLTDTTPPEWSTDYPKVVNVGVTSFDLSFKLNESSTVYYKVYADGDPAPDGTFLKNNGSSLTTIAGVEKSVIVSSGLVAETPYDIYVIAEDSSGNIMATPFLLEVITDTEDTDPPTFVEDPVIVDGSIEMYSADISFTVSESVILYYIILNDGDPALDNAEIKLASNSMEVSGNNEVIYTLNDGLSKKTSYDIYITMEDFSGNVLEEPFLLELTTASVGSNYPASGPFSPVDMSNWGTASYERGAHYNGTDVEFAVYSKNATRILLEIYETESSTTDTSAAYGTDARYDYWMTRGSDKIWRAKLKDVPENTYYAFRAWGPNWTYDSTWDRGNSDAGFISDVHTDGHRFNPNKVLFDPYARELSHDKEFPEMEAQGESGGMFGTGGADTVPSQTYSGPTTTGGVSIDRRNVDTGKWVPKGIIFDPATPVYTQPSFSEEASVIYEAHVRGVSAHDSVTSLSTIMSGIGSEFSSVVDVPDQYRGTYKGVGFLAEYLNAIGVNVIELLPVHETENDMMPFDGTEPTLGGAKNFWGYMTYGFFAPDRRYSSDKSPGGPTAEFQEMVQTLNAAGIKVFLDVVYNHTGEGGNWGHMDVTGFVSMGGFDCAEYYHLVPGGDDKNWLVDGATGCGNQVNFSRENNRKFVMDSLTYWIDVMGVSGYRFDLAAVLGRHPDNHSWGSSYWDEVKAFDTNHPLLTDIAALGSSKDVWMIAEAWDMWGYPVGAFPDGWGEWNGRYRDAIRKYMTGNAEGYDGVSVDDAFHGDWNHFNDQGGPHKSINFLVAHDGFTLADLVSYNTKQNTGLEWPFGPSDGGNDTNLSWDSNTGDTQTDEERQELRRQRLRNFWTFQMFSRGTPMIVYGDELTRTQNGNNNPYNIDSVMTWNNYNMIDTDSPHTVATGYGGVYHNNLGTDSNSDGFNNNFIFATHLTRLRRDTPDLHTTDYNETIGYEDISGTDGLAKRIWRGNYLICSNMYHIDQNFFIPESGEGYAWRRIIDTDSFFEGNNNYWDDSDTSAWQFAYGIPSFNVNPRSMVVFKKVEIEPTDGLKVNIKIPTGWGTLTDLQIGRQTAPGGTWDGWYRVKTGTLSAGEWVSIFLYPYGTDDYSFILGFNENGGAIEIFKGIGDTFFDIANNEDEVWIDMSSLNWVEDGPPKKFWIDAVTYTAP